MNHPTPAEIEAIWRAYDATEARLTAGVSARMVALAGLRPGQRVLDLATGRGEPALAAARQVAPTGLVVGVELDPRMVAMARERAAREGVTNLELHVGDAQRLDAIAPAAFDAVLVRWALMYMNDPIAALTEARRALVPDGALVAALWAEPERVDYASLPRRLLARHAALPPIDFDVPGTFRYADPLRIERDFARAGFAIERCDELTIAVMEAATDAELIAWARAFGMNRLLAPLSPAVQAEWERDLVAACAPLRRDGFVRLGGTTRLVVARARRDGAGAVSSEATPTRPRRSDRRA